MDVRYFRDPSHYYADEPCEATVSMLGDRQWAWMEEEIMGDKTDLLVNIHLRTHILPIVYKGRAYAYYITSADHDAYVYTMNSGRSRAHFHTYTLDCRVAVV